MAEGEIAFSQALCRKACLQVIYAQAELRARSAASQPPKSASPSKPNRQVRPPTPASAVYVVEKVTDALADIVCSFILQVGRKSSARAYSSGRSHTTFYDVVNTLNAMSLSTQSTVRDIAYYCSLQQVSFPVPVPSYPVIMPPATALASSSAATKRARRNSSVVASQSASSLRDVPSEDSQAKRARTYIDAWMPDVPSAYTFVSNPGVLAPVDRTSAVSSAEQRRRVEASLARLRENSVSAPASNSGVVSISQNANSSDHDNNNNKDVAVMNHTNDMQNPFMALPRLVSDRHGDDDDTAAVNEPPREPLEAGDENRDGNGSNADIVETKYSISDQKRARVDRILAESGTIMLSAAAGGGTAAAAASGANASASSTGAQSNTDGPAPPSTSLPDPKASSGS